MLKRCSLLSIIITLLLASFTGSINAQDKPYKDGSVWSMSFIKIKNGLFDEYMNELFPIRQGIMAEAKKQGLIISHKILVGSSSNRDDWDILLMEEYSNWAAFDGLAAKFDAIDAKLVGSEDKRTRLMLKRSEVREILGSKNVQEILPK